MNMPSIAKLGPLPKKLVLALMIVSMAPGLQACTDEEIATGVAIVAIGAAGVAIGVAAGSKDKDRHRDAPACRTETRCRSFRDYYGRIRQECREVSNCGPGRGHRNPYNSIALDAHASLAKVSGEKDVMDEGFADAFSMSKASSGKLLNALEAARLGDASQLAALGIGSKELRRLSNYRLPSPEGIDALARSLDTEASSVKAMLQHLVDIAYEQQQPKRDEYEFGGN